MKRCRQIIGYLPLAGLLFISVNIFSQSRTQLESRRDLLLQEIEATSKKIEQARIAKSNVEERIQNLEYQIEKRNELMTNLCESVDELDIQAIQSNSQAVSLQKELDQLKYDYKNVMQTAYRRQINYHYYLMLLSARSINDFLNWILYIKQFDQFSQEKLNSITNNHKELMDNIYKIESSKQKKLNLVAEQESQQLKMSAEIAEKNSLMAELVQKESSLVKKIRDKEAEKEAINKKIEKIILAEIKASKSKTETKESKSKKNTSGAAGKTNQGTLKSTPFADELSKSFELNQGKLPWPVKKAMIVGGFGRKEHPTAKGIYTNNKGVYIKTNAAADVSAVFEGKVIAILNSPIYKECVLIKHGDYFSLYANLDVVNVKRDSKINVKQVIGKVAYEDTYNCPVLYFEIWKGESPLNPENWLKSL